MPGIKGALKQYISDSINKATSGNINIVWAAAGKDTGKAVKLQAEELHVNSSMTEGASDYVPNEAMDTAKTCVADLRKLYWSDPTIISSVSIRLLGTLPWVQIQARGSTDKGKRSADFCQGITEEMEGSFPGFLRDQFLKEAFLAGAAIAEYVEAKINLPEFGDIVGLANIKVRPFEGFEDGGIIQDIHGNIIRFEQQAGGEKLSITPDRVLYYAHNGSVANPSGVSVILAAKPWAELKESLKKSYDEFAQVAANGMRIGKIPDEFYDAEWEATLAKMKKLTGNKNIVLPESYEMELKIPPGDAGSHYDKGMERCNKEIRAAILYDEILNAAGSEGSGTYGSKKVAESVVYKAYAAEGEAVCEIVAEQLFRGLLDRNGFEDHPTPMLIPQPPTQADADIGATIEALAVAKREGLITENLPPEVQKQIQSMLVKSVGVTYEIDLGDDHGKSSPPASPPEAPPAEPGTPPAAPEPPRVPENKPESLEAESALILAAAPRGRTATDLRKMMKDRDALEREVINAVADTWKGLLPRVRKSINNSMFDTKGNLKSRDFIKVREALDTAVKVGGNDLRKILVSGLFQGYEQGTKHAETMLPTTVEAGVDLVPIRLTPTQAMRMLENRSYLTMGKTYGTLVDKMNYVMEQCLRGSITERQAMSGISAIVEAAGFTPGRANTIVTTSLAQAYDEGRMAVFAPLQDPSGASPGSIIGYQYSSVMDAVTTDICRFYNDKFFKVDDPNLPRELKHYNCRRVLIPVFAGEELWGPEPQWVGIDQSAQWNAAISDKFDGKMNLPGTQRPTARPQPTFRFGNTREEALDNLKSFVNQYGRGYDLQIDETMLDALNSGEVSLETINNTGKSIETFLNRNLDFSCAADGVPRIRIVHNDLIEGLAWTLDDGIELNLACSDYWANPIEFMRDRYGPEYIKQGMLGPRVHRSNFPGFQAYTNLPSAEAIPDDYVLLHELGHIEHARDFIRSNELLPPDTEWTSLFYRMDNIGWDNFQELQSIASSMESIEDQFSILQRHEGWNGYNTRDRSEWMMRFVGEHISGYSATSPNEFIAEVRALELSGGEVPLWASKLRDYLLVLPEGF